MFLERKKILRLPPNIKKTLGSGSFLVSQSVKFHRKERGEKDEPDGLNVQLKRCKVAGDRQLQALIIAALTLCWARWKNVGEEREMKKERESNQTKSKLFIIRDELLQNHLHVANAWRSSPDTFVLKAACFSFRLSSLVTGCFCLLCFFVFWQFPRLLTPLNSSSVPCGR